MTKKATITCKVCGGEHFGLICTKFGSIKVLDPVRNSRPALPAPVVIDVQATPVTKRKAVTKSPVTKTELQAIVAKVGRPAKNGKAMTQAERKAASRAKKKAAK